MEEKQEFENNGFIDLSSQSINYKNKNYKKKKHGVAGFFQRIGEGWKNMRRWKKAVIITVVSLLLVVSIVLGVIVDTFSYDYNPSIDKKPPQKKWGLLYRNGLVLNK